MGIPLLDWVVPACISYSGLFVQTSPQNLNNGEKSDLVI